MATIATDTSSPVKPGYTTTEFYVALATALIPVLNIIFKHDVTPWVQSFGEIAAGIGTAAYVISRTFLKHKVIASQVESTPIVTSVGE